PHRRVNLLWLGHWTIGPVSKTATDLALVVPGDDLGFFGLPAFEEPGLHHHVHQPDRRRLVAQAPKPRRIDVGSAAAAAGALQVEQHALWPRIFSLPIAAHEIEKLRVVETILDLRMKAGMTLGDVAAKDW